MVGEARDRLSGNNPRALTGGPTMHPRYLRLFFVLVLATTVVVSACAKRPALTQTSAPAPAGATGMTSSTTTVTETTTALVAPAPASPQGQATAPQLSEAAPP